MQRTALLLVLAGALLLLVSACARGPATAYGWGRYLTVRVAGLQPVEEVAYVDTDGTPYAVRPQAEGQVLMAVLTTLINEKSYIVTLNIDARSAYLEDRRGNSYPLVDPFARRERLETPPSDPQRFLPFLWGSMTLYEGYQVQGWLLFEVPRGFRPGRLVWEHVDYVSVPLE